MAQTFELTLVVVDSIAAPVRAEEHQGKERVLVVHKLGQALNHLARTLDVPVVIANQVTAYMDQVSHHYGHPVVPCFGLTFTNYIHTRIFLERTDLVITDSSERLRMATIDFCPLLPSGKPHHFIVNKEGVRAVQVQA